MKARGGQIADLAARHRDRLGEAAVLADFSVRWHEVPLVLDPTVVLVIIQFRETRVNQRTRATREI
jgi:hypothetical protein